MNIGWDRSQNSSDVMWLPMSCHSVMLRLPFISQGTSRPCHYHVLLDQCKMSADELQNFTNRYTLTTFTAQTSIYSRLGAQHEGICHKA